MSRNDRTYDHHQRHDRQAEQTRGHQYCTELVGEADQHQACGSHGERDYSASIKADHRQQRASHHTEDQAAEIEKKLRISHLSEGGAHLAAEDRKGGGNEIAHAAIGQAERNCKPEDGVFTHGRQRGGGVLVFYHAKPSSHDREPGSSLRFHGADYGFKLSSNAVKV